MGNNIYAETLIGMTIPKAQKFIDENTVYLDVNHTKHRIMEIREIYYREFYNTDYCLNRLNVRVKNNIITHILSSG